MAQPDYVPVNPTDRVRGGEPMPPPKRWVADRPGELADLRPPAGESFGSPGPDQGYALGLARRFEDRLVLAPGERRDDVLAGCVAVALKRASLFGRAPVIYDLELAFALFGFLGDAPPDLVAWRSGLFQASAHHYWDLRDIVDRVREATLRLSHTDVRSRVSDWRSLVDAPEG